MSSSARLALFLSAANVAFAQSPPIDLREAARLDRAGLCGQSELIYRRALAAGNPTPALLNNAGNHYLTCGNPDKAWEFFERLIGRVPAHVSANLQLARLAVQQGRPAQKFLAVLAAKNDPSLLAETGAMYARLGEFKTAQQVMQRAAALQPGAFEPLWNLGRVAARAGDIPRALEALEAALRLKPQDAAVLHELGLAHATGGDFPRAVFLLAQARQKSPKHSGIAIALARAAEDAGYYGDAVLAYDHYLELQPGDIAAQRDRARVVANVPGRRDEGLQALASYVASQPQDPAGHFALAQLCWNTDAESSLAHLAEAIKLDPRLAPAHIARAWLLHRHGRDAEALAHLEAALAINPADVRALDQYGLVLIALDRGNDAEKALRKAAALAPADWEVRLHLGRVLMEQGREPEARQWLDQYQKLRPPRQRDPRREPGMIDLATLSAPARRAREIDRFRALAAARADDALLRLNLAKLLLAAGRDEEAAAEFNTLLKMNADESVRVQAGRTLLDARRPAQALPFLDPAKAPLDHALALSQTAGVDAALAALSRVKEQSGEFLLLKARLLSAAGRADDALQILTASRAWPGARPQLLEDAALLLAGHGRHADAARLLSLAIEDAPAHRGLLLTESVVLALAGRMSEAEKSLRRLEESWPEWDRPYRLHALLLSAAKRSKDAESLLRTASALSPNSASSTCLSLRDWLTPACRGASQ